MQGMGERLRARARALGLSDTEVARRVGVGQTAYANYVTNRHEPRLPTFVRICSVLGVSPAELLGIPAADGDEAALLRLRAAAAMEALDVPALAMVVALVDGLVATLGRTLEKDPGEVPVQRPARGRRRLSTGV